MQYPFHEHLTTDLVGLVAEIMEIEAVLKGQQRLLPFTATLLKGDLTNLRKKVCLIATTARKAGAPEALIETILKGIKEKK